MNDFDPPALPPILAAGRPAAHPAQSELPLGEDPRDLEPMHGPFAAVESLLRHPRRIVYGLRQGDAGDLTRTLLLIAVLCSLVYGFVVGTFSRHDQLWAAPVKIAGGLLVSAFICLPSLYIFSCLSGARARLQEVGGLIAGLVALMTVLLVGFAPVAWIFSQSTESVAAMGALHLLFWLIATWFGLRFLQAGFAHLGGSPTGLRIWILVFLLVMLQMTAALRPLVGTADTFLPTDKKFFVGHWMENLQK